MNKRFVRGVTALGIFTALVMMSAVPALADHKDGHNNGGGPSSGSTKGCNQQDQGSGSYYDAKCEGSASENGRSGGGGGGKPCAGCVGKADNKNPPGQNPDENDNNKGYECDDNSGAGARRGSGNPAHTGCRRPSDVDDTDVDDDNPPPDEVEPGDLVGPDGEEPCDENPDMPGIQPCGDVLGVRFSGGPKAPARVRGRVLPFTGGPVVPYAVLGFSLVLSGALMLLQSRRGKHLA